MKCSEAMELVTQHLLQDIIDEGALKAAKVHIANCRSCINELDTTVRILTGKSCGLTEEAQKYITCEECLECLPAYSELDEKEARAAYPKVAHHLNRCKICLDDYKTLRSIVTNENTGTYGPLPYAPTFGEMMAVKKKVEPAAAAAVFQPAKASDIQPVKTRQECWKKISDNLWNFCEDIILECRQGKYTIQGMLGYLLEPKIDYLSVPVRLGTEESTIPAEVSYTIPINHLKLEAYFNLLFNDQGDIQLTIKINRKEESGKIPCNLLITLVEESGSRIGKTLGSERKVIFNDLKKEVKYRVEIDYDKDTFSIPLKFHEE